MERDGEPVSEMIRTAGRSDLARIADDPDAFERFYREHVEAVERFIVRRVDDPYLAADLTADVFLAAIASAASYRPDQGAPIGWLLASHATSSPPRTGEARESAARRAGFQRAWI